MTGLLFAIGKLLQLYMCNRRPFMSASDLVIVSYTMPHLGQALDEAPHWQIIEKYFNPVMQ
jgi:hypothetical protein